MIQYILETQQIINKNSFSQEKLKMFMKQNSSSKSLDYYESKNTQIIMIIYFPGVI
jgi:hypothetical protein